MKKLVLYCFFFFISYCSWSQESYNFSYSNTDLQKVITDIENKFDVKYSFVDSVIRPIKIKLKKDIYKLNQLNAEIEFQTKLTITQISERFYTINTQKQVSENTNYIPLKEVVVEEFLARGIKKVNQSYLISPQKVKTLPGITDVDLLQSLQQLPGVKSPNETATGLYIRGSNSDQNLILIDGIRLYHPGHLFGMISCINPNIDQNVNFYYKALNPKYGERVSGVIDVTSLDTITNNIDINAGVNALSSDIFIKMPIIWNKLGIQVSARKSITEWFQSYTFHQLEQKVFQQTNFDNTSNRNKFNFYDYSLKLSYRLNDKTKVSLNGLMIRNNLNYNNKIQLDSINNQVMNIENYGFAFHLNHKYSSKFYQKITAWYSFYNFDYLTKTNFQSKKIEAFKKLNRVSDSGLTTDFSLVPFTNSQLEFGYQLSGYDISHLFNSFNQDFGIVLNVKQLYTNTHSGYFNLKNDFKNWSLQSGIRYVYYNYLKTSSFEPRLSFQNKLTEKIIWQSSFEKRTQIVSQVKENNTNDSSLENYVWIVSDGNNYPIQKLYQVCTGFIIKDDRWLFDIDFFHKKIDGITSYTLGFVGQNDNNNYKGFGFTNGVDILLQRNANNWRAWMTYSFQDSQNQFTNFNSNTYFSTNSDIKHNVTISFTKKWDRFLFTAGWFWHTGRPFSKINELGQPISYNEDRLPNYHRLDISTSYEILTKKKAHLRFGMSIYNVYNRKSLINKELGRVYNSISDFISPKYISKDFYSLGFMPNIFLRIKF